jgi:hypothetical protein
VVTEGRAVSRRWLMALVMSALPAWGGVPGLEAYEGGDYARAVPLLQQVAAQPSRPLAERAQARLYLAAAQQMLGDVSAARTQLDLLFREVPDQALDPAAFVPEFIQLAESVRREVRLSLAAAAPTPPPAALTLKEAAAPAPTAAPGLVVQAGLAALADVAGTPSATGVLTVGVGVGAGDAARGAWDLGLRAAPGRAPAFGLEAGRELLEGRVRPRVGARLTLYPGLPGETGTLTGLGAGAVVGARVLLVGPLWLMADASAEYNALPAPYRALTVTVSGGLLVRWAP